MARRQLPAWQSVPLWLLLNGAGLAVSFLPRFLETAAGPRLGRIGLLLDRKRSKVAAENMRRCLPELSPARRTRLLRENYEHYGILFFELLHMMSPLPGHFRRYAGKIATLHGAAHWRKAAAKGKGVLFCSSHLGNWEMLGATGGLAGMRLTITTRRITPPWLMRKMEKVRLSVGVKAAYQPRTLPVIMKALRGGETVGFVIDQYAPPPMGLKVRFFGVEVDTLSAVGPLSLRTGAPILPVTAHRDQKGRIHVVIEPELKLSEETAKDPKASTQIIAAKVEAWIRVHPAQWLWAHRRFKNVVWPENDLPAKEHGHAPCADDPPG